MNGTLPGACAVLGRLLLPLLHPDGARDPCAGMGVSGDRRGPQGALPLLQGTPPPASVVATKRADWSKPNRIASCGTWKPQSLRYFCYRRGRKACVLVWTACRASRCAEVAVRGFSLFRHTTQKEGGAFEHSRCDLECVDEGTEGEEGKKATRPSRVPERRNKFDLEHSWRKPQDVARDVAWFARILRLLGPATCNPVWFESRFRVLTHYSLTVVWMPLFCCQVQSGCNCN